MKEEKGLLSRNEESDSVIWVWFLGCSDFCYRLPLLLLERDKEGLRMKEKENWERTEKHFKKTTPLVIRLPGPVVVSHKS